MGFGKTFHWNCITEWLISPSNPASVSSLSQVSIQKPSLVTILHANLHVRVCFKGNRPHFQQHPLEPQAKYQKTSGSSELSQPIIELKNVLPTIYLLIGHHPKTFSKIHSDLQGLSYSQGKTESMFSLSSEHTDIWIWIYMWSRKVNRGWPRYFYSPESLKDLISLFGNKKHQNGISCWTTVWGTL